jgi:hypothetical protein
MSNYTKIINDFAEKSDKKELIIFLANYIFSIRDDFTVDIKWRKITFALNNDFHHWICAIAATKNSVNLYFHFGKLLDNKTYVFKTGTSRFLGKIEFKKIEDINKKIIKDLINEAVLKLDFFKNNWKDLNKS